MAIKARAHELKIVGKELWEILLSLSVSQEKIENACLRVEGI
jgi:hypothetical protein